jgi:hypothetical protein
MKGNEELMTDLSTVKPGRAFTCSCGVEHLAPWPAMPNLCPNCRALYFYIGGRLEVRIPNGPALTRAVNAISPQGDNP